MTPVMRACGWVAVGLLLLAAGGLAKDGHWAWATIGLANSAVILWWMRRHGVE